MDPITRIRHLYFNTTRASVEKDLREAVTLLKRLPTEEERERAAVFMDGLAQMKAEWLASSRRRGPGGAAASGTSTSHRGGARRRRGSGTGEPRKGR